MGLITQRLHITPNAFGVLDGRGDTSSTDPVLTWAPVPSYLQKLEGTPFSVDITIYLTSTSADPKTYTLVSGTWPTGWSISSDGTIAYNGTGVGAATIQIKATQDAVSADSQTFTVESIAVAQSDVLAPTIPTGIALVSKTTTTITTTCDAPADVSASDAVPYTGLKEVRWFKGGVFDGVSSTSAGLSLRLSQTGLSSGAGGRKFRGGHYVALSDAQTWSGTPYNGGTYTGIPNSTTVSNTGPVTTDTAGLVLRRRWSALESASGTYTLTSISTALTQLAALSLLADPTGATKILLFVIPEIRTFTGIDTWDNPMPAYLTSVADGGTGTTTYATAWTTGSGAGWQGWRWHATFKTRFQALCAEIGRQFDSHANFGGIATQETSNGATTDGGYSVASYVQALKDEGDYIANGCPTSRHMFYGNFLHSGGLANLLDVAVHIQPLGAIFGGPDLVTGANGTTNIVNNCYPNYTKYHNGTGGVPAAGPTFCSVQQSEWLGNGNPAGPEYMTNIYNYATSSHTYTGTGTSNYTTGSPLNLDIIIWNWQTTAAPLNHNQQYNSDATAIIHAHPTFGTFVAGTTSTFVEGTLAQSGANYTVASLGSGIGATGDEWTAGRATITGDATIIAKLAGITGTTLTSAFAGLSFREIDTPGSKAVHLITTTTGIASKYRSIADAGATTISSAATPVVSTTCFLKISRATNLFSFYYSLDGLAWTALGSISLTLASTIYAEVFAGSGTTTSITASFNQVCIQNLSNPTYTFTGLTSSTTYPTLTAISRDIANNDSAASAALSVTTSSAAVPAYALRSVGTEAHGTSATCGAPAGVVAGDLLLLRADCRNNTDTFTTPTGWTKVSPNTTVTWSALYARIATGTAADNPPAMASTPGANAIICQMACFSGSVYTTLASIAHASKDKHGTNTDMLYDALTVSLDNCLIIAWGAHNKTATSNGAVITALAGFTEIGQQAPNGSSLSSWWGYKQQTTATNLAAATQTRTGTGESLQYTSLYIALRTL